MGNKEALLLAAKECLYTKGCLHTTARDVAGAAGVSLAAIGYHYGTTDALLTKALLEILAEQGNALEGALAQEAAGALEPAEVLRRYLRGIRISVRDNRRIWEASFEAYSVARHQPELLEQLAQGYEVARQRFAQVLAQSSRIDAAKAEALASLLLTLIVGACTQWLVDDKNAPSADDLVNSLVALL